MLASRAFFDDSQFAIENADASLERENFAGRRVVARNEKGRFAARDFQTSRIDVSLPRFTLALLFFVEIDGRDDDAPRLPDAAIKDV